jgi:hypothetical protein
LLAEADGLAEAGQRAQLDALMSANAFAKPGEFDSQALRRWAAWDLEHGIVEQPIDLDATFQTG